MSSACTTTQPSGTGMSFGGGSGDALAEADEYFDQEQYKRALLKYSGYVYAPFANKEKLPYARYKLGLCHYLVGEHAEAVKTLQTLVEDYPSHPTVPQAREIIEKSQKEVSLRFAEADAQRMERTKKILQLQQFNAQDPNNADYHFQLGNLYWESAQFSEAVAEYQKAAALNPAYLQNGNVKDRVRITEQGQYLPKEPVLDRAQQEEVRVINAGLQVKNDRSVLATVESLIFSGEVQNTGIRDVNNVQIELILYDFFERIHEVRMIPIGPLPAGARRPFAAQLGQYKGLGMDLRHRTRVICQ